MKTTFCHLAASRFLLALVLLALAPSLAWAESAGAPNWGTLLYPSINFVLYVICAVYLYKRYIKSLLLGRSKGIEEQLQKAATAIRSATEDYDSAQGRLANVELEKEELSTRFQEEGVKLSELVIRQAEASAERIRKDVGRQIETELNQAGKQVREEVISLAAESAKAQIEKNLSAEDDKRLRKEALGELSGERA